MCPSTVTKGSSSLNPRGVLAAGATLLALSIGAPNACLDVNPADSTHQGTGTWADPLVLSRDNPAIGGDLDVKDPGATGTVSSPYLSDGKWKNITGHLQLKEWREHAWEYVDQRTPILPRKTFAGAGDVQYGTRAGTMVHGNVYELSLAAKDKAGGSFIMNTATYVKLSSDTLVVPVVIVNWKRPGADPSFRNYYYRALNMFDFNPIAVDSLGTPRTFTRPDGSKMTPQRYPATPPLWPNQVDSPDPQFFSELAPDKDEMPPDELWQTCGIQFQVVAQVIAELPAGWTNHCTSGAANLPSPDEATRKELASTPLLRDYLVNDLTPIYVSYADLHECATAFGGFTGNTPGKKNIVEVTYERKWVTTAHELGHALALDHEVGADGKVVKGNLMRDNPTNEKSLTPAQCTKARMRAKAHSDRYDAFNRAIGRTYSSAPPPPPSGGSSGGDHSGGLGDSPEMSCCKGGGDVHYGELGSCPGSEVPIAKCETVCCSNGHKETRFLCEQQGGTSSACNPE